MFSQHDMRDADRPKADIYDGQVSAPRGDAALSNDKVGAVPSDGEGAHHQGDERNEETREPEDVSGRHHR